MLGNQNYRERYENFINNHEEIRNRLPDAVMLRSSIEGSDHGRWSGNAGSWQNICFGQAGGTKSGAHR